MLNVGIPIYFTHACEICVGGGSGVVTVTGKFLCVQAKLSGFLDQAQVYEVMYADKSAIGVHDAVVVNRYQNLRIIINNLFKGKLGGKRNKNATFEPLFYL